MLFTSVAAHDAGLELIGMTVQMDLPELGLTGEAIVTDIQACPHIEPLSGPHDDRRVVTATFHHSSGDVIDQVLADEFPDTNSSLNPETRTLKPVGEADIETIGTTSNHPFWSVDRQEYVQAGHLEIGERLQTLHGHTKTVVSNLPRPGPKADVYNLEVHAEHTYFVGEDGVLVHNSKVYSHSSAYTAKESAFQKYRSRQIAHGSKPLGKRAWAKHSGYDAGVIRHAENTANSRTRYLYQKVDSNGKHLKFGTTYDLNRRYTQADLNGGRLRMLAAGPKSEINSLERTLHKNLPIGPEERQAVYRAIQLRNGLNP